MPFNQFTLSQDSVIIFFGLLVFWFFGFSLPHVLALTIPTSATIPPLAAAPDTTAPTIPILISPSDTTTTENSSPTFVWRRSVDPNGNTVIYTLFLNDIPTYLQILDTGNTTSSNYTTHLDEANLLLTPTYALSDHTYSWYVTASDLSGNTSRSATWSFTLDTTLPPLVATVTQISPTTYRQTLMTYLLLALVIVILLIFIWKRRYNLILLNPQFLPIHHATISHSVPNQTSKIYYPKANSHGRLYLPHLSRYSTLSIRVQDEKVCTTCLLSISVKCKLYTLILNI